MPLSEEELRLLEQMERALSAEDPKFASTLRGTSLRRTARRRAILAGVALAAGVGVLTAGVITKLWALGVVGFIVMLASATWGLGAIRSQKAATAEPAVTRTNRGFGVVDGGRAPRAGRSRAPKQQRRTSGSFMERVEERWRRRRDEGQGF
ncbi:hypothetical protein GCM10022215_01970 [Nocardioides fonticola]|uniref:DUF3040 domain-containing protein n=1 Tax=Nocardioides fonticola TaxID=450363 RepID=A0ABP7X9J2_9ACTN